MSELDLDEILYSCANFYSNRVNRFTLDGKDYEGVIDAKKCIKDLFLELIGEDEIPHVGDMKYANNYRKQLRQKVQSL